MSFLLDIDAVRPLYEADPSITLRAVLTTALHQAEDPFYRGEIDGDADAWYRVATNLLHRLCQPGPVEMAGHELTVATDALLWLARDFYGARLGTHAQALHDTLRRLAAGPAELLAAMRDTTFALDTLVQYSAALLGDTWHAEVITTLATLTHLGHPPVLVQAVTSRIAQRQAVEITSFGPDNSERTVVLRPSASANLHDLATAVAKNVLRVS